MVNAFSIRNKKQELRNFLRNNDIISTSVRGVTTTIETFNGNNSTTDFDLTNYGVKNIREIQVNSNTLVYGQDYNYSENIVGVNAVTTVSFTVAPSSGTDNISIEYDYSANGDRIYDDFPQDFITIDSYPRIGFDILNSNSNEISFSGAALQSNIIIQINAYGKGKAESEEFIDAIRDLFINNKNEFYYWNFISPDNNGPLIVSDVKGGKIFQRSLDLRAEFEFEC